MSLILPDPKLEAPDLLYPGRKPVGPVQIDWEHPLSRGLVICVLPQGGRFYDMTEPETDVAFGSNNEMQVTSGGQALWCNGDNITGVMTGPGSDVYSVVLGVRTPPSIEAINRVAGFGTYTPGYALENAGKWSVYDGGWQPANTTLTEETDYVLAQTKNNLAGELYLDGISDGSYSRSNPASTGFHLGGSASEFTEPGWHYYSYVYDRTLNPVEVAEISRDPYQIFIPA